MRECTIIADDLTGGNATASLFAGAGFCAFVTLCGTGRPTEISCEAVVRVTESRNLSQEEARRKVREAFSLSRRDDLFCKRIDSTLRGNTGAEIEEMLSCLGDAWNAAVVPAFPGAGRIVQNGILYVHGVPLAQSPGAGEDPLCPVHESGVADLLRHQYRGSIGLVTQTDLLEQDAIVLERMERMRLEGARTVVFDAATDDDLERIAGLLVSSGRPFITADPGPMSLAYYRAMRRRLRLLFLIGSPSIRTREQLEQFTCERGGRVVKVNPRELIDSSRKREFYRVVQETLLEIERTGIGIVAGTGLWDGPCALERGESAAQMSNDIAAAFGQLAVMCMKEAGPFDGLFACGGDIAAQVIRALGAEGLRILDQVQPLIAYGRLAGGKYDGTAMITKGGMAGGDTAITDCVQYFERQVP